jgi:hypothetical protein
MAPEGIDLTISFLKIEYCLESDFNDDNFPLNFSQTADDAPLARIRHED